MCILQEILGMLFYDEPTFNQQTILTPHGILQLIHKLE